MWPAPLTSTFVLSNLAIPDSWGPRTHDGYDVGRRPNERYLHPMMQTHSVRWGDVNARVKNAPTPSQDMDPMICWMTIEPLRAKQKLAFKHTTRAGRTLVKDIRFRLAVNTLHRDRETKERGLDDIGRVQLRTTMPLLSDPYAKNQTSGSSILIDEATGVTVGAGVINAGS